jgi:hypothetical protein
VTAHVVYCPASAEDENVVVAKRANGGADGDVEVWVVVGVGGDDGDRGRRVGEHPVENKEAVVDPLVVGVQLGFYSAVGEEVLDLAGERGRRIDLVVDVLDRVDPRHRLRPNFFGPVIRSDLNPRAAHFPVRAHPAQAAEIVAWSARERRSRPKDQSLT